ncbi:hypothetical protein [Natronomonas marina]|jgi:hypothetical protein|uniref:hypothetical protein n=1 Tax=Natronomonas marina TaxID=2961939 RepID=UPI0020C9DDF7|nr:hypothetical protein [Natronomonas marina]
MRGPFESIAGAFGALLAWIVITAAVTFVGIDPLLGVLAATVVAFDVVYYHRLTRVTSAPSSGSQ